MLDGCHVLLDEPGSLFTPPEMNTILINNADPVYRVRFWVEELPVEANNTVILKEILLWAGTALYVCVSFFLRLYASSSAFVYLCVSVWFSIYVATLICFRGFKLLTIR